ncbi:MAG: DinB family protein [Acidobacteria bacterium]|nr:DinB family protein [Acidobacteriota bacterium]
MPTDITALIRDVADARGRMLASVAGLTEDQASYRPSPDEWSIVENVEHIVLAEVSGVSKIWQAALSLRAGAPLFPPDQHTNRGLTIEQIVESTWKPRETAPPVATPHIGGPLEFWTVHLAACQLMLDRLALVLEGLDLEAVVFPHFLCGPLDAGQRLNFLRFHSDRHVQQIEGIRNRLPPSQS